MYIISPQEGRRFGKGLEYNDATFDVGTYVQSVFNIYWTRFDSYVLLHPSKNHDKHISQQQISMFPKKKCDIIFQNKSTLYSGRFSKNRQFSSLSFRQKHPPYLSSHLGDKKTDGQSCQSCLARRPVRPGKCQRRKLWCVFFRFTYMNTRKI